MKMRSWREAVELLVDGECPLRFETRNLRGNVAAQLRDFLQKLRVAPELAGQGRERLLGRISQG